MPAVNQLLRAGFPTLSWHCLAARNRRFILRFLFLNHIWKTNKLPIYLSIYLSIFLSEYLHASSPFYLNSNPSQESSVTSQLHWANHSLYMTMSCSLCVGCCVISWNQVYFIYHQTKMTIVDAFGAMSRSIQLQLHKFKGIYSSQPPLLSTIKDQASGRSIPDTVLLVNLYSFAPVF